MKTPNTKIEFITSLGKSLETLSITELALIDAAWNILAAQNLENKELKMDNERLAAQVKILQSKKKTEKKILIVLKIGSITGIPNSL